MSKKKKKHSFYQIFFPFLLQDIISSLFVIAIALTLNFCLFCANKVLHYFYPSKTCRARMASKFVTQEREVILSDRMVVWGWGPSWVMFICTTFYACARSAWFMEYKNVYKLCTFLFYNSSWHALLFSACYTFSFSSEV